MLAPHPDTRRASTSPADDLSPDTRPAASLPADNHNHSEWSWDAVAGSMEGSCARAVELGLPSIAFTEHVDRVRWRITVPVDQVGQRIAANLGPDGCFDPPPLDVDGYLASIERCRAKFPGLRILTGVELGEPHWFAEQSETLLGTGAFERILGSLHSLEVDGDQREVFSLYRAWTDKGGPAGLVRTYLAEVLRMIEGSGLFQVLAHLDYPIRRWPADVASLPPSAFEEEYRAVLRALAQSGRALEVNTRLPLDAQIVRWWHEVGGEAVSFGSDAHFPEAVATGFAEAAAMVEAQGFRPGKAPQDFWRRALIS
jgi:histidinol-phosphatase (PHP family)